MQVVDSMPYEPSVPCAACARGVDPLRAPAVMALEKGVRYFCSVECRSDYRRADGSRPLSIHPSVAESTLGRRGEELAQVIIKEAPTPSEPVSAGRPASWILLGCLGALALGAWPGPLPKVSAAVLCTSLGALVSARARLQQRELGGVAWLGPPTGVGLLALSGLLLEPHFSLFAAAALGVAIIWTRDYVSFETRAPIERLVADLRVRMPFRAKRALGDLSVAPPFATTATPVGDLRAGDEVVVTAGDVVPVDGVVSFGEARIFPYPTAQEPVSRKAADPVLAGARVLDGSLRVTTTRVGDARGLVRPANFGLEGIPGAAPVTRAAARARSLAAGLIYAALAGVVAWLFARDAASALPGFGAALIAFPTLALVTGVRLPFVSAGAFAASRGIVFRDAATLERTGRVTAAALCTDGTVTQGACSLLEVSPLGREHETHELAALAMGAELVADPHPLATAVQRFGVERGIDPTPLRRASYARGRGVTALVDGLGPLVLGNRQSLLNSGVSVAVADREAQRAESEGRTVIFLSVGGRVRGLLVFEDPVRPEARAAVQRLIDLDAEVVLLSGDHRATVEALARTLDITHVKAELTSEERAAETGRLREAGGVVAVIGRAPADELPLSAADVALTLDAAGSSAEGDVAIASGDLRDAAEALVIARRARRTAQTALVLSLLGGTILGFTVALGVLPPVIALACALAFDVWSLPGAARLLRTQHARPKVAGRGPLSGLFRRL